MVVKGRSAKRIAISGKGGSGKTMLTAILTKLLSRVEGLKLLAIDADSAINLPYALGMNAGRTVAEIRHQIIEDPAARSRLEGKNMRVAMEELLQAGKGFNLLVMGRPEGPGCYCSINDLLRYGIDRLVNQFDITLIDCEAGPEQVNRRVVKGVDLLIIVTDASMRGAWVTRSIAAVIRRDEVIRPAEVGVVINRLKGEDRLLTDSTGKWGLDIIGRIPEDTNISEYDAVGKPLIDLPDTSPSVVAIAGISDRILGLVAKAT